MFEIKLLVLWEGSGVVGMLKCFKLVFIYLCCFLIKFLLLNVYFLCGKIFFWLDEKNFFKILDKNFFY